ncbi:hypothetical protein [Thalassospira povalilytica]|uniref:Lipoprotein n=1 Tax=Thalassospira povalilytica TaxID=732237 RepID=A0A8I1M8R7_9PROT|nr:hypothetical protein [Thalassospira povalilytica]MBN8196965.1 hypothetical protein [Thalassospira povalilytica]
MAYFNSLRFCAVCAVLVSAVVLAGCQTVEADAGRSPTVVTRADTSEILDSGKIKDVPEKPLEVTAVVNVYDNLVTYPMPLWVNPDSPTDIIKESKHFRDQKGPSFVLEQIPADQDFENWKQIYVVSGLYIGRDIPISKVINTYLSGFRQACMKRDVKFYQVKSPENTIVAFCEKFYSATGLQGTMKDHGEVMVRRHFMSGGAIISVTYEWRGPAFNYADDSTWPVSEAEIKKVLKRFETISVSHVGKVSG